MKLKILFFVCLLSNITNISLITANKARNKDNVAFSIIHLNDFHARYEPINVDSGVCKNEIDCIGGFSRLYQIMEKALEINPDSILLNAGDNFEGTLWYDIYKWNVTQYFLTKIPFDAFTLGNHEFEDGIEGLIPYLQHLKSPVVVSNIDASNEPTLQGLFNKSVVIERNGLKIGIIGVLISSINKISNGTGSLVMLDESESINAEAERLVKEEGVFTNIVLSHCGYDIEVELAKNATSKISMIVGGHTHTFLYTGANIPGPDIPKGPYPTVVQNNFGETVLVVQASSYTKYLGNLTVWYDLKSGSIIHWDGKPIFLDTNLSQNQEINDELEQWKGKVDADPKNYVVGKTLVRIDQSRCFGAECLLGNIVSDSMVFGYTDATADGSWTKAAVSLVEASSLRAGISKGNITFYDLSIALPFHNTVDLCDIQGNELQEIFESSIKNNQIQDVLHVSGLKVVYDLRKPVGSQVSIKVRCQDCLIPKYEDLVFNKNYTVAVPSFLADGGLGFPLFKIYLKNCKVGRVDLDVLVDYVQKKSPIIEEISGRFVIIT